MPTRSETSPCRCGDCGFTGVVADFGVQPFTVTLDVKSTYTIRVMARDGDDARHVAENTWDDCSHRDAKQIAEDVTATNAQPAA